VGAFVSIAFVAAGPIDEQLRLSPVRGLGFRATAEPVHENGTVTVPGVLDLMGVELPAIWRLYARDGWTEQVVDLPEEDYNAVCARFARREVAEALFALAEGLMELDGVDPVAVGLEVEVEGPPGAPVQAPLILQRRVPAEHGEAAVSQRRWGYVLRYADDPDPSA
jgi:hypothetical protein